MNATSPRLRGEAAAEELEGTCQSLYDVVSEEDMDDPDFLGALDDLVFLCACCGWWCETSELVEDQDGEGVCIDCGEQEP